MGERRLHLSGALCALPWLLASACDVTALDGESADEDDSDELISEAERFDVCPLSASDSTGELDPDKSYLEPEDSAWGGQLDGVAVHHYAFMSHIRQMSGGMKSWQATGEVGAASCSNLDDLPGGSPFAFHAVHDEQLFGMFRFPDFGPHAGEWICAGSGSIYPATTGAFDDGYRLERLYSTGRCETSDDEVAAGGMLQGRARGYDGSLEGQNFATPIKATPVSTGFRIGEYKKLLFTTGQYSSEDTATFYYLYSRPAADRDSLGEAVVVRYDQPNRKVSFACATGRSTLDADGDNPANDWQRVSYSGLEFRDCP